MSCIATSLGHIWPFYVSLGFSVPARSSATLSFLTYYKAWRTCAAADAPAGANVQKDTMQLPY